MIMQRQNVQEVIKVGPNRRVILPPSLFKQMNLQEGDVFEVQTAQTMLILSHKSFIDSRIDEGLSDIRAGRRHGPFSTAKETLDFLHSRRKTKKSKM
ncbi:hypothetical protein HYV71_04995 [Candidatus Uhrbacteria bacterium]|nr:hypothetical protein [Candidatus Uhrbacteria bacterium]